MFTPLDLDQVGRIRKERSEERSRGDDASMSLDQILTAQLDEPNQKSRVYKIEYGR